LNDGVEMHFAIFLFISSFGITFANGEAVKPLDVNWYKPEVQRSKKKGLVRVRLLGSTNPKSRVQIASLEIPTVDQKGNINLYRLADPGSEKNSPLVPMSAANLKSKSTCRRHKFNCL